VFSLEPEDLTALIVAVCLSPLTIYLAVRGRRQQAWLTWAALIVLVTVPFTDLHGHTHWQKVGWIPFVTPPVKANDILANIVLYAPLGVLTPRRGILTVVVGVVLAIVLETTQLFSHTRFPSFTDVTCDGLGVVVGLAMRRFVPLPD
jgi:glycopeptide antibiotics resistance protein